MDDIQLREDQAARDDRFARGSDSQGPGKLPIRNGGIEHTARTVVC